MQYKTEFTIFRDYDRANDFCLEFLDGSTGHAVDAYRKNGDLEYIVIFDSEDSADKPYYVRAQLKAMRRSALFELCHKHFSGYSNPAAITKAELVDDLLTVTRRQYYADHYADNVFFDIEEYDFTATGYSQGESIKVCNADNNPTITAEYISELFYDAPIHAECSIYKRADSDSAWEWEADFYLCDYTDYYKPSYEEVYKGLLGENNPLAHLVAYDMPADIFENAG